MYIDGQKNRQATEERLHVEDEKRQATSFNSYKILSGEKASNKQNEKGKLEERGRSHKTRQTIVDSSQIKIYTLCHLQTKRQILELSEVNPQVKSGEDGGCSTGRARLGKTYMSCCR